MKIKQLMLPAIAAAMMVVSCNAQDKSKSTGNMKTQNDSISYSLGVSIGNNFKTNNLDSINPDLLSKGMKDVFAGKASLTQEQADATINAFMMQKEKVKGEESTKKGLAYLEENKKKPGVQVTASGMQYQILKAGTGPKPTLNDKITAHYHGTLIDGTVFDSSVDRGQPASFPVSGVIPGWTEALQMMPVGSKWRLVLPSNLAYGERGAGGKIGPNSVLIFEVELISIDKDEKPAETK
ncbi:macrophage infectivity potentiator Mip [soil metagenome]